MHVCILPWHLVTQELYSSTVINVPIWHQRAKEPPYIGVSSSICEYCSNFTCIKKELGSTDQTGWYKTTIRYPILNHMEVLVHDPNRGNPWLLRRL